MGRQHLILAFQDNLGHQLMSRLVDRGFLWCSGTSVNKSNATSIWGAPQDEPMTLSVTDGPLLQSEEQLEDLLGSALEHHPKVTSIEVLGFEDTSTLIEIAGRYGFLPGTSDHAHVYLRGADASGMASDTPAFHLMGKDNFSDIG